VKSYLLPNRQPSSSPAILKPGPGPLMPLRTIW
jgi:hypothetical protein